MVRVLRHAFLQCLLGASFTHSAGALVFDDGGQHRIDYDTGGASLQIYNAGQSPGGAPTHVELADGGDAFTASTYYSSTFLMSGGVLDSLSAQGQAEAEVEGGSLNNIVNA